MNHFNQKRSNTALVWLDQPSLARTPNEAQDYFLEEEDEDGYDEVADNQFNKEELSGSLYSLSFGYGEETTEGMELRDSEVIVVETDAHNKRDNTPFNNLSQESFEEVKTSGIDINEDDPFQIVD